MNVLAFALSGLLVRAVSADEPFSFCKDNTCQDCPVEIASAGTGYPACVIYNSDDIFTNQGFEGSDGGGYHAYLDIAQPDPGCKIMVKSPASTTTPGCGFLVGSFGNAACAQLNMEKTFMVQFCCGIGDCNSAGGGGRRIRRSAKFGDVTVVEELDEEAAASAAAGGGMFGYKLRNANGTVIEPAAVGVPGVPTTVSKRAAAATRVDKSAPQPFQRRSVCESGSWVADAGKEDYTRPADNAQQVYGSVNGPADITITKTREQSWTTTIGASLGFADILSMGMTFEESYSESISESSAYAFHVNEGQSGTVGFTAFLECTTGHGRCNDQDVSGEVCVPYKSGGTIAGRYSVIISN